MHHFDLLQATLHNVVCLTSPVGICFSPSRSRAPHSSVTTANGYDDYPSAHATVSVTLFTRAALMRVRQCMKQSLPVIGCCGCSSRSNRSTGAASAVHCKQHVNHQVFRRPADRLNSRYFKAIVLNSRISRP